MTHKIIERIDRFLDDPLSISCESAADVIKLLKKKIKFNYKFQGSNVYVKSEVDIDDFLDKLEKVTPTEIRIRLKTDKRLRAYVNQGKTSGPFWFAIYFDGNR